MNRGEETAIRELNHSDETGVREHVETHKQPVNGDELCTFKTEHIKGTTRGQRSNSQQQGKGYHGKRQSNGCCSTSKGGRANRISEGVQEQVGPVPNHTTTRDLR
ncbi:Hypothetical predicted protein [Pelobates cultripes]|uniref:Uncharacterized protein n=1 Tax=Pelobates cultripes TaxID=61616 RepID=A0AAD1WB98_PELCU|nr:Hypothetical predicted protein [Pelobates cultripes]